MDQFVNRQPGDSFRGGRGKWVEIDREVAGGVVSHRGFLLRNHQRRQPEQKEDRAEPQHTLSFYDAGRIGRRVLESTGLEVPQLDFLGENSTYVIYKGRYDLFQGRRHRECRQPQL